MTFLEHTYERRMRLMSHWYLDEMVFEEIGLNRTLTGHAINPHFKQLNARYPNALSDALIALRNNWNGIISPTPVDFEELYKRVEKVILQITGIGSLAVYDITLNIGCNIYPKVLPVEYVYVHDNFVKTAAEKIIGGKINGTRVATSTFANIFPMYSAMEIEDILCLYYDKIMNGTFTLQDLF